MTDSNKTPRFGVFKRWPIGLRAMQAVSSACDDSGIAKSLLVLIKLRCSFLDNCSFCIAMHSHEAREIGLDNQKMLGALGDDSRSVFSANEEALLELADELTRLESHKLVANAVSKVKRHATNVQVTKLVYTISQINSWNRLAIADGLTDLHFSQ